MTGQEVKKWFLENVVFEGKPYFLDDEQAEAVADLHKNTIVTARAGSGKTRVIVAKIVFLIAKLGYKPAEISAFVFNRNAAVEINQRISEVLVFGEPIVSKKTIIATTFHKFALEILKVAEKRPRILVGEERDKLIRGIIQYLAPALERNPLFKCGLLKPGVDGLNEVARLVDQFINRAEQKFPGEIGLKKLETTINSYDASEKARAFYQFSLAVYRIYLEKVIGEGDLDFNMLMYRAAKEIKRGDFKRFEVLQKKKYLLVDEYQDFSYLFLNIIKSLREVCRKAHLFVVGDDWQAINRFAGSDCIYFTNFQDYFPEDTAKINLVTNYRSGRAIVDSASGFMENVLGLAPTGVKAFRPKKGKVKILNPLVLKFSKDNAKNSEDDARYYQAFRNGVKNMEVARLLKRVAKLIIRNRRAKSILLLHRNNFTSFPEIIMEDFYSALKQVVVDVFWMSEEEFLDKVSWLTIHRSKGLEAEVVILLEVQEGILPNRHPNENLFEIFGDNARTSLEDQQKLFYVAMTRAKERLYVLELRKGDREVLEKKYGVGRLAVRQIFQNRARRALTKGFKVW